MRSCPLSRGERELDALLLIAKEVPWFCTRAHMAVSKG
jgi:hypothetical protein